MIIIIIILISEKLFLCMKRIITKLTTVHLIIIDLMILTISLSAAFFSWFYNYKNIYY